MKVSEAIDYLEHVKATDGDIKIQSITGFWTRTDPPSGRRMVVPCVGDGKSVEEAIHET